MKLTVTLPDECADYLPQDEAGIAAVLTAGLRHLRRAESGEISDFLDIAEMLAGMPSPQEILAIHPSEALSTRSAFLLEKSKASGGLSASEQVEWDGILRIEHVVRIAKAKALAKLNADHAAA
ncbi:MAG: hypothetical protein JNK37_00880 [Verrucomicrobiales bacterium]|nr:hypothetical protein [Verrucomicrobiales bacterium]